MGGAPTTCEQLLADHRREDAIPTVAESATCGNNPSRTRGRTRATASVTTRGIKHPLVLAVGPPPPPCYYGDIARLTAVAVALEGARGAQQRQTGKILEIDGRRWEGKGGWQSMATAEVCGASAVEVAQEGVVEEEQRAAAAAAFSALGGEAHLWLE